MGMQLSNRACLITHKTLPLRGNLLDTKSKLWLNAPPHLVHNRVTAHLKSEWFCRWPWSFSAWSLVDPFSFILFDFPIPLSKVISTYMRNDLTLFRACLATDTKMRPCIGTLVCSWCKMCLGWEAWLDFSTLSQVTRDKVWVAMFPDKKPRTIPDGALAIPSFGLEIQRFSI